MTSSIQDAVTVEVRRIVEQATFMFTEELKTPPQDDSWADLGVFITFCGEPSGWIHLWTTDNFAKASAMNMLGMDCADDITFDNKRDSLKELLNIAAGHVLTSVFGKNLLFELGIPEPLSTALLKHDMQDARASWIDADGEPLLIVFRLI